MFVAVRSKIVAVLFELPDHASKRRIAVKISRQEKGCPGILVAQRLADRLTPIAKGVAGKYKRDVVFGSVSTNDSAVFISQGFFFAGVFWDSASLAAKR